MSKIERLRARREDLYLFCAGLKRKRELEEKISEPINEDNSIITSKYTYMSPEELMALSEEEKELARGILGAEIKQTFGNINSYFENNPVENKTNLIEEKMQLTNILFDFSWYLEIDPQYVNTTDLNINGENNYDMLTTAAKILAIKRAMAKSKTHNYIRIEIENSDDPKRGGRK